MGTLSVFSKYLGKYATRGVADTFIPISVLKVFLENFEIL
ncbi:hypothetical protein T11_16463 [Trichinella zimbabwensis]|uniref:Uncharacterized protein n=1 Tax=Trichinella zimbabwensis TaxID=268475 RepID=A0A0V1ER77_9BILA|nr:hypothetical protein T11_16463 [Trichinella zimbabwensis]